MLRLLAGNADVLPGCWRTTLQIADVKLHGKPCRRGWSALMQNAFNNQNAHYYNSDRYRWPLRNGLQVRGTRSRSPLPFTSLALHRIVRHILYSYTFVHPSTAFSNYISRYKFFINIFDSLLLLFFKVVAAWQLKMTAFSQEYLVYILESSV